MRSAAKGALTLPVVEMLEILVFLTRNSLFAEDAKMALAGWDLNSATEVASDPATPWEVLEYFVAPENLRPKLLPTLLENSAIREARLVDMAQNGSREIVEAMLASPRVQKSDHMLHALLANPNLTEAETQRVREALAALGRESGDIEAYATVHAQERTQYEIEHAAEIAAEEALAKPFELIGSLMDNEELEVVAPVEEARVIFEPAPPPDATIEAAAATRPAAAPAAEAPQPVAEAAATPVTSPPVPAPLSAETVLKMRAAEGAARERVSAFQKISRLGVSERIQLAIKGSKEERFILVRDGSKLVSQAVLQSPKVGDVEVETFASMKNVQEGVLREIARNHKFIKNYTVIRALVNNPRSPLDLSLALVNHLMVNDLKHLSTNKNIADTLRKLAMKRFKEKTDKK